MIESYSQIDSEATRAAVIDELRKVFPVSGGYRISAAPARGDRNKLIVEISKPSYEELETQVDKLHKSIDVLVEKHADAVAGREELRIALQKVTDRIAVTATSAVDEEYADRLREIIHRVPRGD